MLKFLSQKGYSQGIVFLILMMIASCINDVITKYIGQRLDPIEVIFFRFFFSFVVLLPFIFRYGTKILQTSNPLYNIIRAVLGVISFYLYTYSLIYLQIVEVVTILWSIPLFILIFAFFFLNEKVSFLRWLATIFGFLGLLFISLSSSNGCSFSLKSIYLLPITSAILFATQDILIKKMVVKERRITMLLYFSSVSTILTFIPAIYVWKIPTLLEMTMFVFYGLFANLIQYFLFRAFEAADLSALAPFRYIEFLFSALFGFVFFSEIPGLNVIIGAFILISSTFYLVYSENKKAKIKNISK